MIVMGQVMRRMLAEQLSGEKNVEQLSDSDSPVCPDQRIIFHAPHKITAKLDIFPKIWIT